MPRLVGAIPKDNSCLALTFDDGSSADISLAGRLWGPMFEPLKDPSFFGRVTVDAFGVLTWPNGADLAPATILSITASARQASLDDAYRAMARDTEREDGAREWCAGLFRDTDDN